MNYKFTKREIIQQFLNKCNEKDIDVTVNYILEKRNINIINVEVESLNKLKKSIRVLISKRNKKWELANRKKDRFEFLNGYWLDSEFELPKLDCNMVKVQKYSNLTARPGRPSLPFNKKSERSQRREAAFISAQHQNDPDKILRACHHAARVSGEIDLTAVLKNISEGPEQAAKVRKLIGEVKNQIIKMSPQEALAYLIDHNLSKEYYKSMRKMLISRNANVFPSYNEVAAAKTICRPPAECVSISDTCAEVSLQALLNHTAQRIVNMQADVVLHYARTTNSTELEVALICSWGFDGSSGHSAYKQRFDTKNVDVSDENLFAITLIPLRLLTANNSVLWNNRASQSPRFCRPVKLQYIKESAEVILSQKRLIDEQIDHLQSIEILQDECIVRVHFSLLMTLIDGKVLSIITGTKSTQSCPICQSTSSQFNDLSNTFTPKQLSLTYGISPLHAWIRFLECALHISYRLDIRVWQVRSKAHKIAFANRKKVIQTCLWEKMGLRVDKPKSGGSGCTNDGNTARRAFRDPNLLAQCLGLDMEFLTNLKTILVAISCQLPINSSRFDALCRSTAEIYIRHYSWYHMPSALHKILMHGAAIIRNSILPVGMLGEEASESRNKDYKNYRLQHSRKKSRTTNLEDLFYRAIDSSDPQISSINLNSRLNSARNNKQQPLPPEVQYLLCMPEIENSHINESGASSDSEDENNITGFSETIDCLDELELSDEEAELIV